MPARRWFQIHLSTAVAMMFVAAVFMWLNLYVGAELDSVNGFTWYGWPYPHAWVQSGLGFSAAPKASFADSGIAGVGILVTGVVGEWVARRRR